MLHLVLTQVGESSFCLTNPPQGGHCVSVSYSEQAPSAPQCSLGQHGFFILSEKNFHHFCQCGPLTIMGNNEEIQGEGNRLLGDEPGDPGAPWPAMIRPHSSHNTHCWDSSSCNGCHLKIHLSPD